MAGCDGCTFCCKVSEVTALAKPRGSWCGHCDKGKGCRVYDDRPASCASFKCMWLETQSYQSGRMPITLRPDKSKVMLSGGVNDCLIVDVDPGYPGAWRKPEIKFLIDRWRATAPTPVYIAIGDKRIGWRNGAEYEFQEVKLAGG